MVQILIEPTPDCHECSAPIDTVRHTLEECAAWGPQRHDLMSIIGRDLSLSSVVDQMLHSEKNWLAVTSFCEDVMSQKESNTDRGLSLGALLYGVNGDNRRYLCHLGREPMSGCHHCDTGDEETALQTLQECPAWTEQRRDLVAHTRSDT
ncbi:hypothetical protein K1T71_008936 [Dendrolimus kikuchii]|uniref:Uncharacterized protein n=1 Tax=Dendrolimus kikuchii TaxID=765133 RepID=A0ACC1CXC8_9NEOP|nr:hypothetical protein K1T71_008936 [Dendrolimus kikuchii]